MNNFIKKLFHTHHFAVKKLKYPIKTQSYSSYSGSYQLVDGTAICSECECGKKRIESKEGKYEIFNGSLVRVG